MPREVAARLVLLVLGSTIGSGRANADANHPETFIFGATIGLNWGDFPPSSTSFPSTLTPTYQGTNSWQQLDITLPMYLVWSVEELTPGGSNPIVLFDPPVRINDLFGDVDYPGCPDYIATQLVASYEYEDYSLYTECASGNRLEAPITGSTPVNQDGTIRVRDIFGGAGQGTRLILQKDYPPCTPTSGTSRIIVVIGWNQPGTYRDASTGLQVNALPGTVVNREYTATSLTGNDLVGYYPQLTVLWPSADFAPTTPRVIDSSDLAAYSANAQNPVTWGFGGGPRNFQYNINPFGSSASYFDSGDISVLAAHLGHCCGSASPCQLPGKSEYTDQRAAILSWFGIAATGRNITAGPAEETIPEYDIVDRAQNLRAIADPYGYQRIGSAARRPTPWGQLKWLYR